MAQDFVKPQADNVDIRRLVAQTGSITVGIFKPGCGHCEATKAYFNTDKAKAAATMEIHNFGDKNPSIEGLYENPNPLLAYNNKDGWRANVNGQWQPISSYPIFLRFENGQLTGLHSGAVTSVEAHKGLEASFGVRGDAAREQAAKAVQGTGGCVAEAGSAGNVQALRNQLMSNKPKGCAIGD